MKSNTHGLRTTGTHTGNFGKAKVLGRPGQLDLTPEILNRETLNIPNRDEAFTRLEIAYNTTTDKKLKVTLAEMLRARRATLQPTVIKEHERIQSDYYDMVRRVR